MLNPEKRTICISMSRSPPVETKGLCWHFKSSKCGRALFGDWDRWEVRYRAILPSWPRLTRSLRPLTSLTQDRPQAQKRSPCWTWAQAAHFFHTAEVNLNQTTKSTCIKRPRWWEMCQPQLRCMLLMLGRKGRLKTSPHLLACSGAVKAASAPSSPLKTEEPAPSKPAVPPVTPLRPENPAKGQGSGKNSSGTDKPTVNKKGQ